MSVVDGGAPPFVQAMPGHSVPGSKRERHFTRDRPDEPGELARDGNDDLVGGQLARCQAAKARAQAGLRLPRDVRDGLGKVCVAARDDGADARRMAIGLVASTRMRRAGELPALVIEPRRRLQPLECSPGTKPR